MIFNYENVEIIWDREVEGVPVGEFIEVSCGPAESDGASEY